MAYIYQITNTINGKQYIGKTELNIEKRFKEHCRDAFKNCNEKRPLYAAMRKYGIEHFIVECIEETNNPNEREIYWINEKNTYHNGYNATLGGDGTKYIDEQQVINAYNQLKYQTKVSEELNIDIKTIHKILENNNIPIIIHKDGAKAISAYDLENNFIKSFISLREAAKWIISNNLTSSYQIDKIAYNISRAVDQKKRKTAFGIIWKSN